MQRGASAEGRGITDGDPVGVGSVSRGRGGDSAGA
jgi:hypothetical protein